MKSEETHEKGLYCARAAEMKYVHVCHQGQNDYFEKCGQIINVYCVVFGKQL